MPVDPENMSRQHTRVRYSVLEINDEGEPLGEVNTMGILRQKKLIEHLTYDTQDTDTISFKNTRGTRHTFSIDSVVILDESDSSDQESIDDIKIIQKAEGNPSKKQRNENNISPLRALEGLPPLFKNEREGNWEALDGGRRRTKKVRRNRRRRQTRYARSRKSM
jgi:hypothetical protein